MGYNVFKRWQFAYQIAIALTWDIIEPRHEISNNVAFWQVDSEKPVQLLLSLKIQIMIGQ